MSPMFLDEHNGRKRRVSLPGADAQVDGLEAARL